MAMSLAVSILLYLNLVFDLILAGGDLSDDLPSPIYDLDGASFDEDMDILALLVVELLFSLSVLNLYSGISLACLVADIAVVDVGSIVEQLSQQHTRLI